VQSPLGGPYDCAKVVDRAELPTRMIGRTLMMLNTAADDALVISVSCFGRVVVLYVHRGRGFITLSLSDSP